MPCKIAKNIDQLKFIEASKIKTLASFLVQLFSANTVLHTMVLPILNAPGTIRSADTDQASCP